MNLEASMQSIEEKDLAEILDLKWLIFGRYYASRKACDEYTSSSVDWSISVKLVFKGEIIGFYLINRKPISEIIEQENIEILYENLLRYEHLQGIQGVTLAIHESYRGRGWGNLLKDYPKSLGFDYWWGIAFKTLGNLNDWQKRVRLVGENQNLYLLLEDYR